MEYLGKKMVQFYKYTAPLGIVVTHFFFIKILEKKNNYYIVWGTDCFPGVPGLGWCRGYV